MVPASDGATPHGAPSCTSTAAIAVSASSDVFASVAAAAASPLSFARKNAVASRAYTACLFGSAAPPHTKPHATPRSAFSPSQCVEPTTSNTIAGPTLVVRNADHPALLLHEL